MWIDSGTAAQTLPALSAEYRSIPSSSLLVPSPWSALLARRSGAWLAEQPAYTRPSYDGNSNANWSPLSLLRFRQAAAPAVLAFKLRGRSGWSEGGSEALAHSFQVACGCVDGVTAAQGCHFDELRTAAGEGGGWGMRAGWSDEFPPSAVRRHPIESLLHKKQGGGVATCWS